MGYAAHSQPFALWVTGRGEERLHCGGWLRGSDSYLGEATDQEPHMCRSQSCPLPCCLSHVTCNPRSLAWELGGRVSSAKTLPSQSKSKQNLEEQEERGTNQEKGV